MALLTALIFGAVAASAGGDSMTDASVATAAPRFAEGDFRVGRVLARAVSMLSRRFLPFCLVTFVAFAPLILLPRVAMSGGIDPDQVLLVLGLSFVIAMAQIMISTFSSAVILHGAFQDMRNRPVNLVESLKVGLRRFLPLLGLAFLVAILVLLGFALFIIPGLILYTMWFVSVAACVVERTGPWTSMRRSRQLTKGHRWKIFGLALLLLLLSLVSRALRLVLVSTGGETLALIGTLIWVAISSAFSSVVVAVSYYELRAAKEGIDIEQIASVFD
jgi:hypothetical protein